jgi:Holliday junction resolvase RusA-like endonuclease
METDVRITLRNKGYIRQPDGSYSKIASPVVAKSRPSVPEPAARRGTLGTSEDQAQGTGRRVLRITVYRSRLLDPDNVVPKYEIDALRYAGIIADDSAAHVEVVTRQVKVGSKKEEGTEIIISEI